MSGARLPHLVVRTAPQTERFTAVNGGGGPKPRIKVQDRETHGRKLVQELAAIDVSLGPSEIRPRAVTLEFRSEPGFELMVKSLEMENVGIQLLGVKTVDDVTVATVYVPDGCLAMFEKRIADYLDPAKKTPNGNPVNQPLIDSIAGIRRARLESFWTDAPEVYPAPGERAWWEVWLRGRALSLLEEFKRYAAAAGVDLGPASIEFPDRRVLLAVATPEQMSTSPMLLDCVAELRRAKETAGEFLQMSALEQAQWAADLAGRVVPAGQTAPAVCILDTGVNNGHPLLEASLPSNARFACSDAWGTHDHQGHGTEMAGVGLFGDLMEALRSNSQVVLEHALESVKILPPGEEQNAPELYGAVTMDAVGQVEFARPGRPRTFSLAVTATDARDGGKPSSWSAEVDQIASGALDGERRLICVSAGNTDPAERHLYFDNCVTDQVHDPGQAWNALTVGAYTEKVQITDPDYAGWEPLAPAGDLSPASTTSMLWKNWPIKPDIVLEGGNVAREPGKPHSSTIDSLSLLTTNWQPMKKPFTWTGETSGATAQASRLGAILQAQYPTLWPETIRGLLVHSARWTPAMKARFPRKQQRASLLRCYGYGVPELERARWSARDALTLIAENTLQPYEKEGSRYRTRDMHLFRMPWPTEVLEELGAAQVELRVTLSYFIEPNPGRRGFKDRHRYASRSLRFDVNTPEEDESRFRLRINKAARDEEAGLKKVTASDASQWFVGPDLRSAGSVHSDFWVGTAAQLASRGLVGVYPVIGWWRERTSLRRWDSQARYSLIVSIRTPEVAADVYTPVANSIATAVAT